MSRAWLFIGGVVAGLGVGASFVWVMRGAPVDGFAWVTALLVALAAALTVWGLLTSARDAARQQQGTETLREAKAQLEAEVEKHIADLRASEARWRAIINAAVDGVIVIDARGSIEAFNPGAERLFGYAEADVLGQNVHVLMPSPYREEHDTYIARYLATGVQKIIGIGREVTGRRRDGSTFPVHLSVGEIKVGGERRFTGILHDLTARVRMEEQLREQESLARLGQMAAVIAHEVKNPLAGVRGAIQVIGSRLPKESTDTLVVKEILTRIDALNELMRDLLLFARPPKPRPATVEVPALVASTVDLLSQDPALRGVRIEVDGSAPPIVADAEMLKIVFQNLLVNSAHAMGGQGRIRVVVKSTEAGCHITFSDNGPGIPKEVRARIFTPFFTTKARGSGLGLPTAKRLIEAHQGRIGVECPECGGTVVTVELPVQAASGSRVAQV